jgi:hypothetical protein
MMQSYLPGALASSPNTGTANLVPAGFAVILTFK